MTFRAPIPKIRPSQRPKAALTFAGAIRKGMADEVARQIQTRQFNLTNESGDPFCPFRLALDCRRWSVALALWEHRRVDEKLLPKPDQPREDQKLTPLQGGTRCSKALMLLLDALSCERTRQPLPKADMGKLRSMVGVVSEEDGNTTQTLMRVVTAGPEWLARSFFPSKSWIELPSNAFIVDPNTGHDVFLLGMAAARGHLATVEALLEKGANPCHKNYKLENAAHLAAKLTHYFYTVHGACNLDVLEGRLACFDRLVTLEGVAEATDYSNRTPAMIKAEALAWLLQQGGPSGDQVTAEMGAAYKERLHHVLLPPAAQPSRRPRM